MPRNSQLCVCVLLHLERPSLFLLITSPFFVSLLSLTFFILHISPLLHALFPQCLYILFFQSPQANLYFSFCYDKEKSFEVREGWRTNSVEERTSLTFLRGGLYITLLEYVCLSTCSTCCREKKRQGQDWPLTLFCYLIYSLFFRSSYSRSRGISDVLCADDR